jgi:peptide deformylase
VAERPVLRYPNPLLKQRCREIEDAETLARIAEDLVDTMRGQPRCVGLAAPQIGEPVRLAAVDVTGHPKATSCSGLLVLANPVLVGSSGSEVGREGCLSLPDLTGNVSRATWVAIEARSTEGSGITVEASGFEARVLQHELDHLDGILFLDRIASRGDLFRRRSYG